MEGRNRRQFRALTKIGMFQPKLVSAMISDLNHMTVALPLSNLKHWPMLMRKSRKSSIEVWARDALWHQEPEQLAQHMMQIFGSAASEKVVELVRIQTKAGNRDAAIRWHRVMTLIEGARRNPSP